MGRLDRGDADAESVTVKIKAQIARVLLGFQYLVTFLLFSSFFFFFTPLLISMRFRADVSRLLDNEGFIVTLTTHKT